MKSGIEIRYFIGDALSSGDLCSHYRTFPFGNGDKSRCLQLAPTLTESWSKTMVKVSDGVRHTSHGVCDLFCEGLTSPQVITFDLRVIT